MTDRSKIRAYASPAVLAALVLSLLMIPAVAMPDDELLGTRPETADSLWVEDLDYLARELPDRHKNLFFNLPEAEFYSMVEQLRTTIPELSEYEMVVGIMRILASVGDPHTLAGIGVTDLFRKLPVETEWFGEELFVVRTAADLRALLGRRVLGINGRPIEEVHELLSEVIPHPNLALLRGRGPRHLMFPEILAALGIVDDPDSVFFEFDSIGDYPIAAIPLNRKIDWVSVLDGITCDLPLYLTNPDQYYWFTYLEDPDVLYIKYAACTDMKAKPFAVFTEEVLSAVDSLPVDKLVFDMRSNGGGNSALAGPLISGIKARAHLNRKGRLFVIVGRRTFSSAILNTLELMNGGRALLVGEETGGGPNHYGEVRFFMLPNSGLPIQYSTKYFRLYPEDLPSLYPDMEVQVTFEDLLSCRDPVLEAVLEYTPPD